jgi:hypothetical protein
MPLTNKSISTGCYMGLTCLKWSAEGELSAFDLRFVLGRLARVDRHVAAIWGTIWISTLVLRSAERHRLVRISPSRAASKARLACAAGMAGARRASAAMKDCSGNWPE